MITHPRQGNRHQHQKAQPLKGGGFFLSLAVMVMIPSFQQYDTIWCCCVRLTYLWIFTAFTRVAIPTRAGISCLMPCCLSLEQLRCSPAVGSCMASKGTYHVRHHHGSFSGRRSKADWQVWIPIVRWHDSYVRKQLFIEQGSGGCDQG
ncbi:hypothetical protein HDV64DRAFT_119884 [Trichoderma sp. TUCIM 5745]